MSKEQLEPAVTKSSAATISCEKGGGWRRALALLLEMLQGVT